MSGRLETHWQNSLQFHKNRLTKVKQQDIIKQIDYASFQTWLEAENTLYNHRHVTRRVKALASVLEEFEVFVRSITTMVEGGGSIACFVWGSIQAVLDVSISHVSRYSILYC
jgi:hypothetical protein